jgi:hypothetical protein
MLETLRPWTSPRAELMRHAYDEIPDRFQRSFIL